MCAHPLMLLPGCIPACHFHVIATQVEHDPSIQSLRKEVTQTSFYYPPTWSACERRLAVYDVLCGDDIASTFAFSTENENNSGDGMVLMHAPAETAIYSYVVL